MAVLPDDSSRGKHAVTHFETLQRLDHARQSVIRYWGTLSMDALRRRSNLCSTASISGVRRCTPQGSDSDILSAAKAWISAPKRPSKCGNLSTKSLVEIDETQVQLRLRPAIRK
jgi:hypothetical protein